jgi:hypothetical protein
MKIRKILLYASFAPSALLHDCRAQHAGEMRVTTTSAPALPVAVNLNEAMEMPGKAAGVRSSAQERADGIAAARS